MSAALRSAVPDARIEPRIEEIDQQVGHHEHQGHQHDQRLDHGVAALADRADEQLADTVEIEDLLGHDEPAHQERELRSEEHTSELQSLMRSTYAVFCLTKTPNATHAKV